MKHKCDREVVWLSKTESPFLIHQEVDADYRGEIGDFSKFIQSSFEIQNGERIAQLIIAKHDRVSG
jgi:dUTPase